MKRNERTSPRVARIAARVLRLIKQAKDGKLDLSYEGKPLALPDPVKLKICLDFNGVGWGPFNITLAELGALAASCLTQTADKTEVERLRKRLEMTHVYQWDKKAKRMKPVKVKPGEYIPDGIECRDETIRLQDEYIKELQARIPADKPKRRRRKP